MTDQDRTPRWQALQIGPGGLPPESVRPNGPGAPGSPGRPVPPAAGGEPLSSDPWVRWARAELSPEPPRRGPSPATITRIVAGVVVLGIVVGLALWSNSSRPLANTGSASVTVGDCLSADGRQISGQVACTGADADFAVVGRYAGTSDASECSASPSDVAVIATGPTVLCLDYVAVVGECLFAGNSATQVGKVGCDSTQPGVFKVEAVLRNSINPDDCPSGTLDTLVHRYNSQVICLARR